MKKIIFSLFILVLVALHIIRPTDERLMLCASGIEMKVLSEDSCISYFDLFGVSEELIGTINTEYSLTSVLSFPSPNKYYFAQALIDSDYDINQVTEAQVLPLHGAIIANDVEMLEWLLARKADPRVTDSMSNMNAYEFIKFIQTKKYSSEREEMQTILQESAS